MAMDIEDSDWKITIRWALSTNDFGWWVKEFIGDAERPHASWGPLKDQIESFRLIAERKQMVENQVAAIKNHRIAELAK